MKKTIFASLTILAFSALMFCCSNAPKQEKMLRHVVMFGFKPEVSAQQIKEVEDAFCALPSQIDLIKGYEWGTGLQSRRIATGIDALLLPDVSFRCGPRRLPRPPGA